jgi:hypothetical protein
MSKGKDRQKEKPTEDHFSKTCSHSKIPLFLSQLRAVEERDAGVVAAARALVTVIEDPLLPILKEDSSKTEASRQIGLPGLDDDSDAPVSIIFVKYLVPDPEIDVFSIYGPWGDGTRRHPSGSSLR